MIIFLSELLSMVERMPLTDLKGVGTQVAAKLAAHHIHDIEDLLLCLPIRYEDRTHVVAMADLVVGQTCLVQGEIMTTDVLSRPRRRLMVKVRDKTGVIQLRFIHFYPNQVQMLRPGRWVRCFGEIRATRSGLEMIHPEYQLDPTAQVDHALTPVYGHIKGVTSSSIRRYIQQALQLHQQQPQIFDHLPEDLRQKHRLLPLDAALRMVHQPSIDHSLHALQAMDTSGHKRLIFEELLAHQLSLRQHHHRQKSHRATACPIDSQRMQRLLDHFPFTLTSGQQQAIDAIGGDLQQPKPMQRLLQGDVGSGKTVIAAMAAWMALGAQLQVAVMAPTELLAEQLFRHFSHWFETLGVPVYILTGSMKRAAHRQTLDALQVAQPLVVVGTHALFQERVQFARLGLVIIDEQHRFGVQQRLDLRDKGQQTDGSYPHLLAMTATPIPRTLTMTLYADMDVTVLQGVPPGRQPVKTAVMPLDKKMDVIEKMAALCHQGQQVYWICPFIDVSEHVEGQTVDQAAALLQQHLPDELRVGMLHGQMSPADKDAMMDDFRAGQIQVLVATTVVEVGVDVPNATLMVIENAERLGLSQLHQLRGRVGRGAANSYCILLYRSPISQEAKARLTVLRDQHDGFLVAEQDLKLRGPGELFGTRQTGSFRFRVADWARDHALLPQVQQAAQWLLQHHPQLVQLLLKRWVVLSERLAQA